MMSRIAVIGGSGKLGRNVVADLVAHGNEVVNFDRVAPREVICPFVTVEIGDYGQVVDALHAVNDRHSGLDAVVHLAAIPAPGLRPDVATFVANLTATFHVFAAAKTLGISQLVWASSETVLGLPFDEPPPYVPVDEEYAPRPESFYSLAKILEEEMARQFSRWNPEMSLTGLRFSNVMEPADYAAFPAFDADPKLRRWNLWGYIDARDGAQAVRLALDTGRPGVEVYIIAAADTVMVTPNRELVAAEFPGVEIRGGLGVNDTLLSIAKARQLLGYAPERSWRDHV